MKNKGLLLYPLIVLIMIIIAITDTGGNIKKSSQLENKTYTQAEKTEESKLNSTPSDMYAKAYELEKFNPDAGIIAYKDIIIQHPDSNEAKLSKEGIQRSEQKLAEKRAREAAILKEQEAPLELIRADLELNVISNPELRLIVKNTSNKTVDAFTFSVYCYDRFDRPVNHYLHKSNIFSGISQKTIPPKQTSGHSSYWTLHGYERTSKVKIILEKVHTTDGVTWTPVRGETISINGKLNE